MMPDREKVMKALEVCGCVESGTIENEETYPCAVCPYSGVLMCWHEMKKDALALLKEQEAEIRQLRLALDIAKGTCKGIVFETDEKFMGEL